MRLIPWVGVAALLKSSQTQNAELKGRAYCFLPLPAETGLPVHVNGFFELSANRRDIWYGDDMAGEGKVRSAWNNVMLEDAVAPTYARLLRKVSQMIGAREAYYQLWPAVLNAEPWATLVRCLYHDCASLNVLHSAIDGGRWVQPAQSLVISSGVVDAPRLVEVLLKEGMTVVEVPAHIAAGFEKVAGALEVVTPALVRQSLKQKRAHPALSDRATALFVLEYCLTDVAQTLEHETLRRRGGAQAEEAASAASAVSFSDLCGVPLLPLSDGSFGTFEGANSETEYFVCSELERSLLSSLSGRLVSSDVASELTSSCLRMPALHKCVNVKQMNPEHLCRSLPHLLPREFLGQAEVPWSGRDAEVPTVEWVKSFWSYMLDNAPNLSLLSEWPLVPTENGVLCKLQRIPQSRVVDGNLLTDSLRSVLGKLGCRILSGSIPLAELDLSKIRVVMTC